MAVTNKIVVWGSNPNQYDSGNPYQPDANGNEKGFTPGTLNYALYLNKALRNASIVPHALAQMLTHSPVSGSLDINFDINPGDIPTFDANFRSAFDAYVKSTIKVDNATHADTADACTGNSATATKLQTARTIGGVSFDGSADINLPGVNTAGNQNTSGNAATATKATGDQSGNNIKATYGASIEVTNATNLSSATIKLKNKNGTTLSSVSLSKVSNAFSADNAIYASKLNGFQTQNTWIEITMSQGRGNFSWTKNNTYEFRVVFPDSLGNYNNFVNVGIITIVTDPSSTTTGQMSQTFPAATYTGNTASPLTLCLHFGNYYGTNVVDLAIVTSTGLVDKWDHSCKVYYRLIQTNN